MISLLFFNGMIFLDRSTGSGCTLAIPPILSLSTYIGPVKPGFWNLLGEVLLKNRATLAFFHCFFMELALCTVKFFKLDAEVMTLPSCWSSIDYFSFGIWATDLLCPSLLLEFYIALITYYRPLFYLLRS